MNTGTVVSAHELQSENLRPHLAVGSMLRSIGKTTACCSRPIIEKPSSYTMDMLCRVENRNVRCFSSAESKGSPKGYCLKCGSPMVFFWDGDRDRLKCSSCNYVHYQNPKMVVGAIVEHEDKILLCRRGIEPQYGYWTIPAGYLEMGESTAEGAQRETLEEADAVIDIIAPYCHYDIVNINQTYLLFRAQLAAPFTWSAKLPESTEAALFALDDIPFDELAFSSVSLALSRYVKEHRNGKSFSFQHGTIEKKQGSNPNESGTFQLVDTWEVPSR